MVSRRIVSFYCMMSNMASNGQMDGYIEVLWQKDGEAYCSDEMARREDSKEDVVEI